MTSSLTCYQLLTFASTREVRVESDGDSDRHANLSGQISKERRRHTTSSKATLDRSSKRSSIPQSSSAKGTNAGLHRSSKRPSASEPSSAEGPSTGLDRTSKRSSVATPCDLPYESPSSSHTPSALCPPADSPASTPSTAATTFHGTPHIQAEYEASLLAPSPTDGANLRVPPALRAMPTASLHRNVAGCHSSQGISFLRQGT